MTTDRSSYIRALVAHFLIYVNTSFCWSLLWLKPLLRSESRLSWSVLPLLDTVTQMTLVKVVTSKIHISVLARERVSGDDLLWQAQLSPQRSDFIFMKIFQWFDYLSLQDERETGSATVSEWGEIFLGDALAVLQYRGCILWRTQSTKVQCLSPST